jgi:hypothetical protein
MKVLKEITVWEVEHRQPNHTYLLSGDKVVAYKKWHEGEAEVFKKPMRFDRARRKFTELKYVATEWGVEEEQKNIVVVEGSKGNTYEVDLDEEKCNCPGHTYRGHCKHIDLAKSRVALAAA